MLLKSNKFYNYLNTFYFFKKKNFILQKKIIKEYISTKKNFNKLQLKKSNILKHLKSLKKPVYLSNYYVINSYFFIKNILYKKKKKKLQLFLNFKFKKNNIILSLIYSNNKLICITSMGLIKIKTKRKKFDFFSMILLGTDFSKKYFQKKKQKNSFLKRIKGLHIKFSFLLKNFKFFYSLLHSFLKKTKLRAYSFIETIKLSHNGLKKKRVKRI